MVNAAEANGSAVSETRAIARCADRLSDNVPVLLA